MLIEGLDSAMSEKKTAPAPEMKAKGFLSNKSVRISEKRFMDELKSRGYGVSDGKELLLNLHEALYLLDRYNLEIEDEQGDRVGFQRLLQCYEAFDENAWAKYLVFRDLRSRGYVVREGFGPDVDFRVYERGDYSKDTAKYLVLSVQEGKGIAIENLTDALTSSLSLKKELVLAVMNRRGEIVYYSVSELGLKQS
jgi:tRNA-intron endonuclease